MEIINASQEDIQTYLQRLSNHVCRNILSGVDVNVPFERESIDKFARVARVVRVLVAHHLHTMLVT